MYIYFRSGPELGARAPFARPPPNPPTHPPPTARPPSLGCRPEFCGTQLFDDRDDTHVTRRLLELPQLQTGFETSSPLRGQGRQPSQGRPHVAARSSRVFPRGHPPATRARTLETISPGKDHERVKRRDHHRFVRRAVRRPVSRNLTLTLT